MSLIDWIVLSLTVCLIVGYGIYKTTGSKDIQSYLLGGNEAKWWTVGLSVMATQASAITFLSTPGQAYNDGMGFAQFYLMLPVAMIIICITFIPIFYKLKVYTAYQFLENRFDLKTRSLTAGLFLVQRGLATGITIYAPAIILSSIIGWNLQMTTIVIGLIAVLYTVSGGTKAVHVTHKLQMFVIFFGLIVIFFILLYSLPDQYTFKQMLQVANANDKLEVLDFNFDWKDRYNVWTSLAALFLFLSYFGTDQSQVQRYISSESIRDSKMGLLMNGLLKVPLQFFILFLGVLVFLFFQFEKPPVFFNENTLIKVRTTEYAEELASLESAFDQNYSDRTELHTAYIEAKSQNNNSSIQALQKDIRLNANEETRIRGQVKSVISKAVPAAETNDKDYVFINYILNYLPKGLVGLLLAVILFAAMSSTSSELNALGSTTSVDIYRRSVVTGASEEHYLKASKWLTFSWGLIAILFASFASLAENLIQFVNIVGSVFYGSILGIFLIAFYIKFIKQNAVFYGALLAESIVIFIWYRYIYIEESISFLWLNIIGCLLCILFAMFFSMFMDKNNFPEKHVELN